MNACITLRELGSQIAEFLGGILLFRFCTDFNQLKQLGSLVQRYLKCCNIIVLV